MNSPYFGQYNPPSYANGAFYADEQDTFVAGTSPPSSPTGDGDDVTSFRIILIMIEWDGRWEIRLYCCCKRVKFGQHGIRWAKCWYFCFGRVIVRKKHDIWYSVSEICVRCPSRQPKAASVQYEHSSRLGLSILTTSRLCLGSFVTFRSSGRSDMECEHWNVRRNHHQQRSAYRSKSSSGKRSGI